MSDALAEAARAQRIISQAETEQEIKTRVAPLEQKARAGDIEKALTSLRDLHGQEVYDEVAPGVLRLLKEQPNLYGKDDKGVTAAWGLSLAERQNKQARADREAAAAETPETSRTNNADLAVETVERLQSTKMNEIFGAGPQAERDGLAY